MSPSPIAFKLPNASLLPAFYFLPFELVSRTQFHDMPRNPRKAVFDESWRARIADESFPVAVVDCLNQLIWPAFNPKTSIDSFSENDPVWKLSFDAAAKSVRYLEAIGYTSAALLGIATDSMLDYLPYDTVSRIMRRMGELIIEDNGWHPIIECINENRCFEDYHGTHNRAYIDFYRRWHHSRTVETVPLQSVESVPDLRGSTHCSGWADEIIVDLDYERFRQSLLPDERRLLEMCAAGWGQERIARELGCVHSTVSKKKRKLDERLSQWLDIDPPQKRAEHRKRKEALKKAAT